MDHCGGSCVDSRNNDGCVAEPPACAFPCGGYPDPEACSSSMTQATAESGDSPTTGNQPACLAAADCTDLASPICMDGACVACTEAEMPDAACGERDAGLPACGSTGTCVECTSATATACSGETPVCDDATNTCTKCTAHEQCGPEAACSFITGSCITDCVVHVDGDGGQDHTTIEGALRTTDGPCVIILHALTGANSYDGAEIPFARQIALFGAEDGPRPRIRGAGIPGILVAGTAYLRNLEIRGTANDPGIRVNPGRVYLDASRVVLNEGGGLHIELGGDAIVRNSMLGGDISDAAVVDVDARSSADIVYSTLLAGGGTATALRCDQGATTTVRNSIVVSRAPVTTVDCPGATLSYSAFETTPGGQGNVGVGLYDEAWFSSVANGDFHLSAGGIEAFGSAAVWRAGDPPIDFDGEMRVNTDGSPEAPGADLPTP